MFTAPFSGRLSRSEAPLLVQGFCLVPLPLKACLNEYASYTFGGIKLWLFPAVLLQGFLRSSESA
jgi:hypothetical protein